jgi:hypothetical protein
VSFVMEQVCSLTLFRKITENSSSQLGYFFCKDTFYRSATTAVRRLRSGVERIFTFLSERVFRSERNQSLIPSTHLLVGRGVDGGLGEDQEQGLPPSARMRRAF